MGPNGAGKTTLLRTLIGARPPIEGRVFRDVRHASPKALGYVPQRLEVRLALPTSVDEFVGLGLVGLRLGRTEIQSRVRESLEEVGLEGYGDRDVRRLSGGQFKRALLSRALVRRPRWLALDEPTAGLDLRAGPALIETLARLNAGGLTLVVVSHSLEEARRLATHAVLIAGGTATAGPVDEVLGEEALAAAYGEEAP